MAGAASDSKTKGIAAAKAGQATLARLLLRRALIEQPDAADAWLWLSEVVQDPAQRADCLRRALAINPADATARAALERLTSSPPPADSGSAVGDKLPAEAKPKSGDEIPQFVAATFVVAPSAVVPNGVAPNAVVPNTVAPNVVAPNTVAPNEPVEASVVVTRNTRPGRAAWRALRVLASFVAGVALAGGPAYYLYSAGRLPAPRPIAAATVAPLSDAPTAPPTAAITPAVTPSPAPRATQPAPRATLAASPLPSSTPVPTLAGDLAALYYRQASALLSEGKYAEAIRALDEVLAAWPDYYVAYNDRGYAYFQLSAHEYQPEAAEADLRRAIADLDRAIALAPSDATPYTNRAAAYEQLARAELYRETRLGHRAQAVADLTQAQALGDPRVTDEMLAVAHLAAGNCSAALDLYDNLLWSDLSPRLFAGRALAHDCLGNFYPALTDIDRAWTASPHRVDWLTTRAAILRDMGAFDEALTYISKAIDLDPYSGGQRYFLRATLYYDLGQMDLALKDIEIGATSAREQWGEMYYVLGHLAWADGQRAVAQNYLDFALATLDDGPFLRRLRREMLQLGFQ